MIWASKMNTLSNSPSLSKSPSPANDQITLDLGRTSGQPSRLTTVSPWFLASFLCYAKTNSLSLAADLHLLLFNAIRSNPDSVAFGREGIYFAENSEYTGYEIAKATSQALVELGVSQPHEPTAFTTEELDQYFGVCTPCFASIQTVTNCCAIALHRKFGRSCQPTLVHELIGPERLAGSLLTEKMHCWRA